MIETLMSGINVTIVPPPTTGKKFLITADTNFATNLVSGAANTGIAGVTRSSVNGNAVMSNVNNGYLTFAYDTKFTPFSRGAKIEIMLYLSPSDVFPGSVYPCLMGYMQPSGTLNYWSFGIMGPDGGRKIAFYAWNGGQNLYQGTQTITKNGWVKLTLELTDSLVLSVDGVEHFRKSISDTELQKFVSNQNPGSPVPLTFYRVASTTNSATKIAYVSVE